MFDKIEVKVKENVKKVNKFKTKTKEDLGKKVKKVEIKKLNYKLKTSLRIIFFFNFQFLVQIFTLYKYFMRILAKIE